MKIYKLFTLISASVILFCAKNAYSADIVSQGLDINASGTINAIKQKAERTQKSQAPAVSKPAAVNDNSKPRGAVILTVPGIDPTTVWNYVFSKTNPDGTPKNANVRRGPAGTLDPDDAWLKDYFGIESQENYEIFKEGILQQSEQISRAGGDLYNLENAVKRIPNFSARNLDVHTFSWTRDAKDSAIEVLNLMNTIVTLSKKAQKEQRPFYIFSHSWGSMLSHTALHRLYRSGEDVSVHSWITAGSPLVPANSIVGKFVNYNVALGGLETTVRQPKNVYRWVNVWAERDLFSNRIPSCQFNYQADAKAHIYEEAIKDQKLQIIDWAKLRNPAAWHSSYHSDFHAVLSTINMRADILVFPPHIQPEFFK